MSFLNLTAASRADFAQLDVNIGNLIFSSTALPFDMQHQTQSNWCWAATSTSVSHFYYSASGWTQCLVAGAELGLSNCCASPVPSACNVPWYLDRALTRTMNFSSIVSGTITYSQILAELQHGRPIGARIGWSGGGGHFMVIYGCSRVGSTYYVDIDDPIYGKSHITLATFTSNYQGSGSWTHTYYTKKWPTLKIKLPILEKRFVDLIEQVRPLVGLKGNVRDLAALQDTSGISLAVPHNVYVVGLQDLAGRKSPSPVTATALRVLEVEDGRNRAVYELSTPREGQAEVQSITSDPATLEATQNALAEVQRIAEESDAEPELHFIRIPALYVDAFLLHYPGNKRDMVVPVRDAGLLTPFKAIPAKEFYEQLRRPAQERLRASRDDTIAP